MSLPGIYPHFHFHFFNARLYLLWHFSNHPLCTGFSTKFFINLFLHSLLRNQSVSLGQRWQLSYLLEVFLYAEKNLKYHMRKKLSMCSHLIIFGRLSYEQKLGLYEYFLSHGNQIWIGHSNPHLLFIMLISRLLYLSINSAVKNMKLGEKYTTGKIIMWYIYSHYFTPKPD
jgi:hypothetical protein